MALESPKSRNPSGTSVTSEGPALGRVGRVLSGVRALSTSHCARCLLRPRLGVNLRMPLLLITSGKRATTHVTFEWFLPCVCSYVRGEVVRPTELPQTDAALEWFLSWEHCVYPDVSRQLVASRKPAITLVDGTGVRPLVDRRLARPVWVFPRSDGHQADGHRGLLEYLVEYLVALAGGLVELGYAGGGGGRRPLGGELLLLRHHLSRLRRGEGGGEVRWWRGLAQAYR